MLAPGAAGDVAADQVAGHPDRAAAATCPVIDAH
jgi:hypothetical protein